MSGRSDRPSERPLIAVGVDSHPQACDASLLASTIAGATGAELLLVTVHPAAPPGAPRAIRPSEADARSLLPVLRGFVAPRARTAAMTDRSVARGLARVVAREHPSLLVVGSSRHASEGSVRIGPRTRRLLGDVRCPVAIASRGLCAAGQRRIGAIGAGYDGTPEAREALRQAGSLARATGARLRVRAVVDQRLPYMGLMPGTGDELQEIYDDVIDPEVESLREDAEHAASAVGADVAVEASAGSPQDELIALSREVDLLVIGSRGWGSPAQVLLGSTGEELTRYARCSVMVVSRARARDDAASDARSSPRAA